MKCIEDGILRALIDGELGDDEAGAVARHLEDCADCQRRAETLAGRALRLDTMLSLLAPSKSEIPADARMALARFKTRHDLETKEVSMIGKIFAKRLAPLWAALVVLIFVISFAPARAWASKFLELFRVRQITVVPVDTNFLRYGNEQFGRRIGQLISDNINVTKEPGQPQQVAGADEASRIAGFDVRMLDGRENDAVISVSGEGAFQMTVNRQRLQTIINEVGRADLRLPASIDGAQVVVELPRAVLTIYGNCPRIGPHMRERTANDYANCLALAQSPSPTVLTPPELNVAQLAELGLQLIGMKAEEARAFSQTIDWTSTLVLPIPHDAAEYRTVEADGVKATLILQHQFEDRPPGYTLLWVKNGVIYSLTGFGDPAQAPALANSLK